MSENLKTGLRQFALGLILASALIAITSGNVEFASYPVHVKSVSRPIAPTPITPQPVDATASQPGRRAELESSWKSDEIADQFPLAGLSTMDALTEVLNRGVKEFSRETLRSSEYRDETGYDVIHYRIYHHDDSISHVIVSVEQPEEGSEPEVRKDIPVVMVLSREGEATRYALYRQGLMVDFATFSAEKAEALLAKKLSASVPFLSVAR